MGIIFFKHTIFINLFNPVTKLEHTQSYFFDIYSILNLILISSKLGENIVISLELIGFPYASGVMDSIRIE